MTQIVRLSLLVTVLSLLACGDDGGDEPDAASVSPSCMEATQNSDLTWIQDNIFTNSCAAFTSCHQGGNPAGGLNLEAGNSEIAMVGQPSTRFPSETLVIPGDPQNSYLMVALGSYTGELSASGVMPPGNPQLCVEKREAIERWISSLSN